MKPSSRTTAGLVGLVSGLALLLAGCAKSGEETTGTQGTPAASAPSPTTTARGTVVKVTETEYFITVDRQTFTPGVYTFVIHDAGAVTHNFNIMGPGVNGVVTSNIGAGGTTSLTVTLQSGSYELWCSIGAHKESGMDTTITVT